MKNKIELYHSDFYLRNSQTTTYTYYHPYDLACGATSNFSSSVHKALGELAERLCLYTIQPESSRNVTRCQLQDSGFLVEYLGQPTVENKFEVDQIDALNLITWKKEKIPLALISFHPATKGANYYTSCDTTGCAVHEDIDHAFDNALLEFCERQAFFGVFYGHLLPAKVNLEHIETRLKSSLPKAYREGQIIAFDFGVSFGCHVVLTVLNSTSSNCCNVVTGLGCDLNLSNAIEKSFSELIQICRLSHKKVFVEKDVVYSALVKYAAFEKFFKKCKTVDKPYAKQGDYTIENIIQNLSKVSKKIYLYSILRKINGKNYTFCKILSPDFYLVSQWQNRNIRHHYEKLFIIDSEVKNEICPLFIP